MLECADPSYKQENPFPGGTAAVQSPQTEVVGIQLKPLPQELRRAVVTGHKQNRKWLTAFSLQSDTVFAVYSGAVCHGEDGDKDSDDDDSKERKKKAMDRIVSMNTTITLRVCVLYAESRIEVAPMYIM